MAVLETRPEQELDRSAELTELRRLAEQALGAYALNAPKLRLLEHKKNATFRVDEDAPEETPPRPRRYVLRLCEVGVAAYGAEEIRSEMEYLEALSAATGLTVPLPVRARDGSLVISRRLDEESPSRFCALFRWVPGKMVEDDPTAERLEKVGALLGTIHRFSERFEPSPGFSRPHWDADALFGTGSVLEPGQGSSLVSERGRELLTEAARAVREEMDRLGRGREVFGLIHKDLEPDNTLIDGDRVHAIDFADCGWGHYLYDIASSLLPLKEKVDFPTMREAFVRGYQSERPLAPEHLAQIETFLIARSLFACRLMLGKLWELPQIRSYARTAIPQILGGVRRYLEQRSGAGSTTRTTVQFLREMRSAGVELWAEGESLRFKAPKGVMTREFVDELKDRKAEILGFLRHGARATSAAVEAIPKTDLDRVPLSFAQQRLWFIDQLLPGSAVYNIARALRLAGTVNVATLVQSLNEVVRRHESLRTVFALHRGEPFQGVRERLEIAMPVVDLSALPADRRPPEAHRLALEEARRPFDLERGPLLRVGLLRLDRTEHVAPSTMHHIIGDGWSSGLLFRELGDLYRVFVAGSPSPMPELPIQYPDFAAWQRRWLTDKVLDEQLAFWRDHLTGAPQILDLPTDRPRSSAATQLGDREALLIPRPTMGALRSFAQARGATLFMILLAAFETLLYRYSGQDDVVVGSPIANRNRAEIEALIGFFANTLVLRARLGDRPRFRDLLERVRQSTLGAYAHQDLPFEKIVEELRPDRGGGDNPFFQVVMTLQNVPYPDMQVSDFRMTLMPPTSRTTPFDLSLNMKEMPEGVRTSWNYRQDLFDATTIRRMAGHYLRILEAVVEDPDLGVDELPLLDSTQRHHLLCEHNDTAAALPPSSLSALFAEWVRRTPDAPAVITDGETWSYRRLAGHAATLAGELRAHGVGAGELVGISSRRSPEMIAGLLAIVGAGAAYVPLDPEYPQDRLSFMLQETAIRVALVSGEMEGRLAALDEPGSEAPRLLRLDDVETGGGGEAAQEAGGPAGPDHLAYVLYTSGSTGRPKGSAVPQRAVVRLVRNTGYVSFGPSDRTAHMSNTSFDAATFEIWGPLLHGGALVVLDRETILSPAAFVERLRRHRVSAMFVTVSLFNQIVREVPDAFRTVRTVLFGGEAADPASVRLCLAAAPPERLLNGYGPTEATTFACTHAVERVGPDARTVPIGRPITNTTAHVLDRSGRPVPLGVVGELYLGGPGLAWGYWRRPGLTAERFVPNPVAQTAPDRGGRLYRTGDRVRRLAGGAVEYLGRFDDQVKIRGFRIEPGEIAVALEHHPGVAEAAVKVWEVEPGERRLAAYVVAGAAPPAADDLRGFLQDRLPDFMIPQAYVFLPAMPLTANGKLDRAALPEPAWGDVDARDDRRLPATATEELVAGVWQDVLRIDGVGADQDFFDLGGHSLLATQVSSRLRQIFEVELPLQTLFEATTVRDLALVLDQATRHRRGLDDVALEPAERLGALPLSFAQQRLWFLDQLEPGGSVYNVPAVLQVTGPVRGGDLAQILTEVARRQESLRIVLPQVDGQPTQVIRDPSPVALRRVDLTGLEPGDRGTEADCLARREVHRPFDLGAGPLARFTLIRIEARRHVLGLVLHHVVSDGWSLGVLLREVAALAPAFRQGHPSPLPELRIQYADFAAWQHRWLAGGVLEHELAYWKRKLDGAPAVLELPMDRPRPATESFRGHSRRVVLSPEGSRTATALARREGVTLYMLALAAFQALLARWSGQDDVVVGSPIAGRPRRDLEDLIGFFVNTLVLRTDLGGAPSFRQLLARVRKAALEAYAHQNLPFERLVEELAPRRDLSHSPLFQVMLVLQNAPVEKVELPDLTLSRFPVAGETSMFDLTLSLTGGDDGAALGGTLTYHRDLFDTTTMERFARGFCRLLEAAAADPEIPLPELPWGSAAERHQLLLEHDDLPAPRPEDLPATVHGWFEAQTRRSPKATALLSGQERWSYGELDRQAERLARRLRQLGVGVEDRVGICLRRSPWMVAALLAVWKSGGAYVPLDPAYPRDRLAFMLEDADIEVLVAEESTRSALPETRARVLDPLADLATDDPNDARTVALPALAAEAGALAYVIYTSGSTGRPKGVAIGHRSAVARLGWAHETFTPEELSGVLASTSINFDLSVFELFAPLTCGGRVILAADALELAEMPATAHVRLINTVPSAMTELLRLGAVPTSVEAVNLAGEPLRRSLVEDIYATGHVRTVRNLYGPSEDTTYSTGARVEPGGGEPTIGRPLPGTRAYVLDRWMCPAPLAVPGELFLAGEGLARGYLGRPSQTARAWLPNPFGSPGSRLYGTGDRVRRRANGELQFLGRLDHQVKLRGYRIELGEIEAALLARPAVCDAVVVARRDDRSGDRLTAYVEVAEGQPAPTPASLRDDLARTLPDYMIPAVFVVLAELPRTPNGKIDRRSLPEPDRSPACSPEFTAPRTPEEELVASCWAGVLGLDRVGIHDDFFDLGGHSLLGARVISRVRQAFDVDLPLARLFESPTVAGLARTVDEARRRSRRSTVPPLTLRTPGEREDSLPLSFAQERLWFFETLGSGRPVYNMPAAIRVHGAWRPALVRQSLREVVRRHQVLRTRYPAPDGTPRQEILPAWRMHLPRVDLSSLEPLDRQNRARLLARTEARRAFDLARDLPLRVTLVQLAPTEQLLLSTFHHIASDAWSTSRLLTEMSLLQQAFRAGRPSPLDELPLQYADFAVWQRTWLRGEILERELEAARERLQGAPQVLDLPSDRPRPAAPSYQVDTREGHLSPALTASLGTLGRRSGATLFMVLLTGFQALLGRWAGRRDVLVGSPVAGRPPETEELIGLFVNSVVLRARWQSRDPFAKVLEAVRREALSAYDQAHVPFERLVEHLVPDRELNRSPLVQVMIALQNAPQGRLEAGEVGFEPLERSRPQGAAFDLTLVLEEDADGGLVAALHYARDLFDATTAERFLRHYDRLLRDVVQDDRRPLAEQALWAPAERHQVLTEWNDAGRLPLAGATLLEPLDAQIETRPDAVAVVGREEHLSYGELALRSDRLARVLRARTVGLEEPVGLAVGRTPERVVGVVGILRAGAAFLPLDPDLPAQRLAGMVEDAGVRWAVADGAGAAVLELPDLRVLPPSPRSAEPFPGDGLPVLHPDQIAYLIYTSGSTGRPKGVAVPHRGLVHVAAAQRWAFGVGARSRVLQFSSPGFDASVFELVMALGSGATLCLGDADSVIPGEPLANLLEREQVTIATLTPSNLAVLPETVPLPALETLTVAGEVCRRDVVERWAPGRRFFNLYGPTESTIWSTVAECAAGEAGAPPIGRPVPHVTATVRDRDGRALPLGVAGELCLAGSGLARGYLGLPARTAGSFVPDPDNRRAGGRLYRTGDLARLRADGRLEFLGRLDQQVKVRGVRVELGEVEAALCDLPEVVDAAVILHGEDAAAARLVAYLVFESGREMSPERLHRELGRRLPEPMIPSVFVPLETLPLSPSGKVDRKALPPPDLSAGPTGARILPRTPLETELAALWQEVLGSRPVGVHDDFFSLGGQSLLAVRLVTRIRRRFGRDLSVSAFLGGMTVERLAAWLEDGSAQPGSPLVRLREGSGPPWVLVHAAGGEVAPYAELVGHLGAGFPVVGVRAVQDATAGTLEEMARGYVETLLEDGAAAPACLVGWSSGGLVAFEMARQLDAMGRPVPLLALLDSYCLEPGGRRGEPVDDRMLLGLFTRDVLGVAGFGEPLPAAGEDLVANGYARLRDEDRLPPEVDLETFSSRFSTFCQQLEVLQSYRPGVYPGRVALFCAEPHPRGDDDPRLRWKRVTLGDLAVHHLHGRHQEILTGDAVRRLADLLTHHVERLDRDPGDPSWKP